MPPTIRPAESWYDIPDEPPERDEDEPRRRRSRGCQCGGDMPGRCPGPENCPLCEDDDDTELDEL